MGRPRQLQKLTRAHVSEVVLGSRSQSEAARRLGVSQGSVSRWLKAGKLRQASAGADKTAAPALPLEESGSKWAQRMRSLYIFSAAELPLLDVAAMALDAAHDQALDMNTRLQAAAKFCAVHKQINFPREDDGANTTYSQAARARA